MELKAVSHLDHWLQALHLLTPVSKCWGSLHHALLYVILLSVYNQIYIWFFQAIVGDDIQLDPSEAEARASSGTLILACMPALDSITSIWQSGQMSAELSLKVMLSG